MTLQTFFLYLAAVFVLTVTPGPSVLMCITNGIHHGVRRAFAGALGSVTAVFLIMVVSAAGLGAILAVSEKVFLILKWCGVAYLAYIGVRTFFSSQSTIGVAEDVDGLPVARTHTSRASLYWQGFLVGGSNLRVCSPVICEVRSCQKACWQAMQRRQCAFWQEPCGNDDRRRLPLLQLLAVAPLRRVAAPRQSTPVARSHSQMTGEQTLSAVVFHRVLPAVHQSACRAVAAVPGAGRDLRLFRIVLADRLRPLCCTRGAVVAYAGSGQDVQPRVGSDLHRRRGIAGDGQTQLTSCSSNSVRRRRSARAVKI